MFFRQAILFFFLIEAFLLFVAIGKIGFFYTVLLCTLSALAGALLIQRQGLGLLMKAQKSFQEKAVPVDDLFSDLYLVVAGLLFLMPGFLSDICALALLIPAIRLKVAKYFVAGFSARTSARQAAPDDVIEGSYVRVQEMVEAIEKRPDEPSEKDD